MHFVVRHATRRVGDRLTRFLVAMSIGVAVGLSSTALDIETHFSSLLVRGVGGALWIVAYSGLQMGRMTRAADGYILWPQEVTLSDECVRGVSRKQEALFHWLGNPRRQCYKSTAVRDGYQSRSYYRSRSHVFVRIGPRAVYSRYRETSSFTGAMKVKSNRAACVSKRPTCSCIQSASRIGGSGYQ